MQNKKILITGGAGYIGSHTNALLNALRLQTLVVDNLSLGHKESLQYLPLNFFSNPMQKEINLTQNLNKINFQNRLNISDMQSRALNFLSKLAKDFNGGGGGKPNIPT